MMWPGVTFQIKAPVAAGGASGAAAAGGGGRLLGARLGSGGERIYSHELAQDAGVSAAQGRETSQSR